MATFYYYTNNGVTAVVTEKTQREIEERIALRIKCSERKLPDPELPPIRPVFTFAMPTHHSFPFMTGSNDLMMKLLKGHSVRQGSIYVPFSNGIEWNYRLGESAEKEARFEWEHQTSLDEAIEAFELKFVFSETEIVEKVLVGATR